MNERHCQAPGCAEPYSSKGYCKVHAARVSRNGTHELVGRTRKSLAERLSSKVDMSGGPDACWPWTGTVLLSGYGRIRTGSTGEPTVGAHRAAWMVANPDAERPESVDHLCHDPEACHAGDNCPHRRCCNPAHLRGSTVAENSAADRQWSATRDRTHCTSGHEYTEANTRVTYGDKGQVTRKCRACDAETQRRRTRTLRCGRLDEHEQHEWTGPTLNGRRTRVYDCTGHVLTTLAEQQYADRADFNDKRDDELREWLRAGWSA